MFTLRRFLIIAAALLMSTHAQAACRQWSLTTSANATADPTINWQVGMSPSSVDASGRAMMARLAECRDDLSGKLVTGGTSTAYTLTSNQGLGIPPQDGQSIAFRPNVANGLAPTLAVDGGAAYPLRSSTGIAISAGAMLAGTPYRVTFNLSAGAWMLQDFYNSTLGPASISTALLQDEAVTYQKFQLPSTTSILLGTPSIGAQAISNTANNGSGLVRLTVPDTTGWVTGTHKTVTGVAGTTEANGTWVITVIDPTHIDLQGSTYVNAYVSGGQIGGFVEEITLGTGLTLNGNTLAAPAFPPAGAFRNLSIKVASTTTVAVAADFVTMTDGTNYLTHSCSGTLDLGSNGAVNKLDAGTIAIDTWYAVFCIAKSDGTTGSLASTSASSPTLPTGYTYKARIGWVRTIHASAALYGTWQLGRRAQYVVNLASTAALPQLGVGPAGTYDNTTPTFASLSVSSLVPLTASAIRIVANTNYKGAAFQNIQVAPNGSYKGMLDAGGNMPLFDTRNSSIQGAIGLEMMLESTNIYWTSGGAGGALVVLGWEDNL